MISVMYRWQITKTSCEHSNGSKALFPWMIQIFVSCFRVARSIFNFLNFKALCSFSQKNLLFLRSSAAKKHSGKQSFRNYFRRNLQGPLNFPREFLNIRDITNLNSWGFHITLASKTLQEMLRQTKIMNIRTSWTVKGFWNWVPLRFHERLRLSQSWRKSCGKSCVSNEEYGQQHYKQRRTFHLSFCTDFWLTV